MTIPTYTVDALVEVNVNLCHCNEVKDVLSVWLSKRHHRAQLCGATIQKETSLGCMSIDCQRLWSTSGKNC